MFHDSKGPVMSRHTLEGEKKKFVRFVNDSDSERSLSSESLKPLRVESPSSAVKRGWEKGSRGLWKVGRSLRFGSSRVYSEDFQVPSKMKILDPRSNFCQQWNKFFVITCLVAIFVDPLFYYLPVVSGSTGNGTCIAISKKLAISVTVFRTTTDILYLIHMALQFRTAFIAPSSTKLGRGVLVVDPHEIAMRYLKKDFWLDFVAVLPLPQLVIWIISPRRARSPAVATMNMLRYIIIFQYLPRVFRMFPLISEMVRNTGVLMETAWAGAACNLLLYLIASHVVGACWYFLAVDRQVTCWRYNCQDEDAISCIDAFFDCSSLDALAAARSSYLSSNITTNCDSISSSNPFFNYGIYTNAISNGITTSKMKFMVKYFYCVWTGLLSLSSLAQTFAVSTYIWEIVFTICIIILGLLLFAFLIGNMQTYLQSLTVRLEEMRVKRRDAEEWMKHRQLPPELVERVRRFDQYRWAATRGVDEEDLVQSLPLDLRRDIKRHLCLDLVRQVPLFDQMDNSLLDAMCERLKPVLSTEHSFIVREGDPVNEMLFIIRGKLETTTTNGGRTGFFNSGIIISGGFCGEELLTWALDPKPSNNLPTSTRTVQALVEVEAFALSAEDLKFVASQFRRLHSKQLQHTFRYYSHQWRTWAACFVQAAWRRYCRRKIAELRRMEEDLRLQEAMAGGDKMLTKPSLGAALMASRFATNAMRGVQRLRTMHAAEMTHISNIPKPTEPDFSLE
ncbi:unnamed protein product [Sphagnum troendelagicum]|uniref:Cyclic nucleotide-binding domain-containing protein n=1 Tax=Sphagnum troendelagicum TaxID=128251 RepID=A0ABP0V5E3_9BRYO